MAISEGIALVTAFLFVPETVYLRDTQHRATTPIVGEDKLDKDVGSDLLCVSAMPVSQLERNSPKTQSANVGLRVFSGSKSSKNLVQILARPFFHLASPAVILGIIVFSVSFNWLPLVATVYGE